MIADEGKRIEPFLDDAAKDLITRYRPATLADRHLRFVVSELAPARYAYERSMAEIGAREMLAHMMFLRLVAEVGIRFGWIVSRGNGNAVGIRKAIDSLAKRDLMHLRAAGKSLGLEMEAAEREIAAITEKEAPRQIEQLATPPRRSELLVLPILISVGASRIRPARPGARCSRHGGGASGRTYHMHRPGAEMLTLLAPKVEPMDIGASMAHPILGYSPTAIALRLRRELRRAHGLDAPAVENVSMTLAGGSEGWEQTLQAVLVRGTKQVAISATDADCAAAYAALEQEGMTAVALGKLRH